jgi:hypothetical protein
VSVFATDNSAIKIAHFESTTTRLIDDFKIDSVRLGFKIEDAWEALEKKASDAGNLKKVLLIKDLAKGNPLGKRKATRSITELIASIAKAKKKISDKRYLAVTALRKKQLKEAEILVIKYTKVGKIDDAIKIQSFIDKITKELLSGKIKPPVAKKVVPEVVTNPFIGRWKYTKTGNQFEYFADGTIAYFGRKTKAVEKGTWKLNKKNQLEVFWSSGNKNLAIIITNAQIKVTVPGNKVFIATKVK